MKLKRKRWPKVVIIILNYNRPKETILCLKSLQEIDYKNYKIILVDNGSTDNSLSQFKKLFPRLTMIGLKKNLGFAAGNNVGIKQSISEQSDYTLLLNNDIVVGPTFLSSLVKKAEESPKIGLVGPKIYYFGSKVFNAAGGEIKWSYGEPRCIGHLEKDKGQYEKAKDVDYLPGSCLLIKDAVFKIFGFLPEDYFFGFEDVEYALLVKKSGFRVIYQPTSVVYHKESASIGAFSLEKDYYYFRNCLIFMRKWVKGYALLKFLFFFHLKILKMSLKMLFLGRLANLKAIWQGYLSYLRGERGERK